MKRSKEKLVTVALFALSVVGLSLLLYPIVSDYWNSFHQTRAVASYSATVESTSAADRDEIRAVAQEYNAQLAEGKTSWLLTDEQKVEYEKQLAVDDTGIMGYVDIPSIECTLPIYHGTDEAVLQIAAGHIEGSSLPVGGESTHCVISGHRGLPSAKLFTDIDQLLEGDVFMLRVLGETLTYEVDQILVVLPHEVDSLEVVAGEDYCTLVTCTPYGVNTHRLLVRGHRVATVDDLSGRIAADAILVDPDIVSVCLAVPVLVSLFAGAMVLGGRKKA